MNARIRLLFIVIILSCRVGGAAETPKYVPVASYINRRELRETVGVRVAAILSAHKIKWVGAGSLGMSIDVPADRASEALQLLANAIKEEGLQLTLYVAKGDRITIVTPDSILEPMKSN